jgi:hypothetical protein
MAESVVFLCSPLLMLRTVYSLEGYLSISKRTGAQVQAATMQMHGLARKCAGRDISPFNSKHIVSIIAKSSVNAVLGCILVLYQRMERAIERLIMVLVQLYLTSTMPQF